jgi:hypothetical protein
VKAIKRSPAGRYVQSGACQLQIAPALEIHSNLRVQLGTANKSTMQLTPQPQHKPAPQRRTRLHDVGCKVVVSGALVALGHPSQSHAVPKPGQQAAEGRQADRSMHPTTDLGCVRGMCSPTKGSRAASQALSSQPQPAHLQLVFVASPHQNSTW